MPARLPATERSVAICTERVEAKHHSSVQTADACVAICTERVEAKILRANAVRSPCVAICTERVEAKAAGEDFKLKFWGCNLHGACGGKATAPAVDDPPEGVAICTERVEAKCAENRTAVSRSMLQSARSVWRQSKSSPPGFRRFPLQSARSVWRQRSMMTSSTRYWRSCNLHGACGGKGGLRMVNATSRRLQSARSVWRQSQMPCRGRGCRTVAICTERVEAK